MNLSSQPENQLDNDKDDLKRKLGWAIAHGTYMDEEARESEFEDIIKQIDQYTQSKLKAFAGEFELLIQNNKYDSNSRYNLKIELRESLKAIKEKAGIE